MRVGGRAKGQGPLVGGWGRGAATRPASRPACRATAAGMWCTRGLWGLRSEHGRFFFKIPISLSSICLCPKGIKQLLGLLRCGTCSAVCHCREQVAHEGRPSVGVQKGPLTASYLRGHPPAAPPPTRTPPWNVYKLHKYHKYKGSGLRRGWAPCVAQGHQAGEHPAGLGRQHEAHRLWAVCVLHPQQAIARALRQPQLRGA